MAEILQVGVKPGETVYETRCRDCETRFRFKRVEAEFVGDQRDGNSLVIPCPLCGVKVWKAI